MTPWTPKEGMVLKHRTLKQTVWIVGLRQTPAGPFWLIAETSGYTADRPWMIQETNLIVQYEPKEVQANA